MKPTFSRPIHAFNACRLSSLIVIMLLAITSGPLFAQTYNQIQFVVGTGSNDLRSDSSATAALINTSGGTLQVINLKTQSQSGWGNNSSNTVTATLSPALTRAQISSVVITLTSHNGFGESSDNWDINTVTATLSNNGSGAVPLLNSSGNPQLARLTGSAPSFSINAPPPPPTGTFNQVQFVIGTGSDDLRGDSSATATLKGTNGTVLQVIDLKPQSKSDWGNNSSHTVDAPLTTPLKPSDIVQIVITLTSHNGFGETDDNWNVNSVNVSLSNNGSGAQQVMSFSGNPLKRLTGSDPSLTLPPVPVGPAGTFNTIQFVIVTGSDDLRGDSSATAALLNASGSTLQMITLKSQSDPGWGNNTTNTISRHLALRSQPQIYRISVSPSRRTTGSTKPTTTGTSTALLSRCPTTATALCRS